jgi:hypothetical protein
MKISVFVTFNKVRVLILETLKGPTSFVANYAHNYTCHKDDTENDTNPHKEFTGTRWCVRIRSRARARARIRFFQDLTTDADLLFIIVVGNGVLFKENSSQDDSAAHLTSKHVFFDHNLTESVILTFVILGEVSKISLEGNSHIDVVFEMNLQIRHALEETYDCFTRDRRESSPLIDIKDSVVSE